MSKAQIVKRKGGPIPKKIKEPLLEELIKIVESGGILGINNQQLSDKFSAEYKINITRQTIAKMLHEIYLNIPPEDIGNTRVKLQVMFDKIFREAQKMLQQANTLKDKREAMDLLLRCMEKFTDFLERFGVKDKVADRVELSIEKQLVIDVINDPKTIEIKQNGKVHS